MMAKATSGRPGTNTSLHRMQRPQAARPRPVKALAASPRSPLARIAMTRGFKRLYMLAALGVLFTSTLFWSLLGARLQNNNADQLADSFLFRGAHTFRQADFPVAHTFLLKWPLFWLQSVLPANVTVFEVLTITVTMLTVAGLALLLYRLERRPVMFGTLVLALSSVLLLVPPVPYPGALLPTNFAMLTTRNIEYLLYILALVCVINARRLLSWRLLLGALCLGLLFASDKLFLSLSFGGVAVMIVIFLIIRRSVPLRTGRHWLAANLGGAMIMEIIILTIERVRLTGLIGDGQPYAFTHNLHDIGLGVVYGVAGVFTNFGANPVHSVLTLRAVPSALKTELGSASLLSYAVNAALLGLGLYCLVRIVVAGLRRSTFVQPEAEQPAGKGLLLALMLLASSLAAGAAFVCTKHYYVVDSRYLTITMITIFVCLAVYSRSRSWRSLRTMAVGGVLVLTCLSGSYFTLHTYNQDKAALLANQQRNNFVAQILKGHPTSLLVGDYWRLLPIKLGTGERQNVMPLAGCTTPRQGLSSQTWQPDLRSTSFTYLLTLDGSGTGFPRCDFASVTRAYGQPNAMAIVAGTTDNPREVLLFYDHGTHRNQPADDLQSISGEASSTTVRPVPVDNLLSVNCPSGRTVMQIVAHEDDDLLFMSPDLEHANDAGDCIRTIYITAGDAGSSKFYWLGRERGSEAAYANIVGVPDIWLQQTVKLADHEFATITSPSRDPRLTLIFMHLPDGNVGGEGFGAADEVGLAKLESGAAKHITSVDGQSTYSYPQLVAAVNSLINFYSPDELRTQLPYDASDTYHDHSDHMAVGRLATTAYQRYQLAHADSSLAYYTGYPVHDQPDNVTGDDLARKQAAFYIYSSHDPGTGCGIADHCSGTVYDVYLQREYRTDEF